MNNAEEISRHNRRRQATRSAEATAGRDQDGRTRTATRSARAEAATPRAARAAEEIRTATAGDPHQEQKKRHSLHKYLRRARSSRAKAEAPPNRATAEGKTDSATQNAPQGTTAARATTTPPAARTPQQAAQRPEEESSPSRSRRD